LTNISLRILTNESRLGLLHADLMQSDLYLHLIVKDTGKAKTKKFIGRCAGTFKFI